MTSTWFTSISAVEEYGSLVSSCVDDCSQNVGCIRELQEGCANTEISVVAEDDCGNKNYNSFLVQYDPKPPTVDVKLGAFPSAGKWWLV